MYPQEAPSFQVYEECKAQIYVSLKKYGVLTCQDVTSDLISSVFVTGNVFRTYLLYIFKSR